MVAPYVGAGKDYLAAPLFLLFGARVVIVRLTAILLGALCIAGLSVFLSDQVDPATAIFTALALSVNPAFIDQILFDSGNIALSMGLVGAAAFSGNRFLRSRHLTWAFAFGLILGLSVWSRLNLVWLIGSLLFGAAISFKARLFERPKALLFIGFGLLAGVASLVFFLSRNASALRNFMRTSTTYHSLPEFFAYLRYRLAMFGEIFFSDGEHRAIWSSHPEFGRAVWASALLALAALVWCVLRRGYASARWTRCLAIASFALSLIFLITQEPVAEHHLVILLPLVVPCVIAFLGYLAKKATATKLLVYLVASCYTMAAIGLEVQAVSSIHKNGGLGEWSDAIDLVYRSLDHEPEKATASVLDWGLQANIFFLSRATLSPAEIFWGATSDKSGRALTWTQEVTQGGLFLTTASSRRVFPVATAAFEKALVESKLPYTVQQFEQNDGAPYALLYRVGKTETR
jgi:hypothetical protein